MRGLEWTESCHTSINILFIGRICGLLTKERTAWEDRPAGVQLIMEVCHFIFQIGREIYGLRQREMRQTVLLKAEGSTSFNCICSPERSFSSGLRS